MKEVLQADLDKMIAKVDAELQELLTIKNNLVEAKKLINKAIGPAVAQAPIRAKCREVKEASDKKARQYKHQCTWPDVRDALKQLYPEMVTVTQLAELMRVPRSIVSYHTSTMRRLLKREYVKKPNGLHWEYRMTLKNPPHVDGVPITSGLGDEDHKPIVAIDKYV